MTIAALSVASTFPAQAVTTPPRSDPARTVTQFTPLARSVSIEDASRLGSKLGLNVVGYRYENPGIIGEYFQSDADSNAQFVASFRAFNGTEPQVVGLITRVPAPSADTRSTNSIRSTPSPLPVPSDLPTFAPPKIDNAPAWDRMQHARSRAETTSQTASALRIARTWQPTYGQYMTFNQNGRAKIWQDLIWSGYGSDSTPLNRDLNWGLEFEVNQQISYYSNTARPACGLASDPNSPAALDRNMFWAVNRNYNWTLYYTNTQTPASLGAYADTNDLLDQCNTQSMAIGIRSPGLLTTDGQVYEVAMLIDAPRGTLASTTPISANIQQVEGYSCNGFPWNGTANTDCMGLNQGARPNGVDNNTNHGMLNSSRGYRAAGSCWETYLEAQLGAEGAVDTVHRFTCPA